MKNNEVHGQVGQLQPGAPGVGQHMTDREQKAEIFQAQYPERYTGEANTEVQPTITGVTQNYNKKFSKLRISNVCKLAEVKIYKLLSLKGFDGEKGQLCMYNMFTLKQYRNKLCKMDYLLPTEMDKAYPEQLVKMLSTGVVVAVFKSAGVKGGWISQTTQSAYPGLCGFNVVILQKGIQVVLEEEDDKNETMAEGEEGVGKGVWM